MLTSVGGPEFAYDQLGLDSDDQTRVFSIDKEKISF